MKLCSYCIYQCRYPHDDRVKEPNMEINTKGPCKFERMGVLIDNKPIGVVLYLQ